MRNLFLIFIFSFATLLYSDTTSVTENDPNALVEGVSVITGDFSRQEEDLVIKGVQPIRLGRSYVSQKGLGYWDVLSYHVAFRHCEWIEITEPSGAVLIYQGDCIDKPRVFTLKNSDWKGITNTARGSISGKYNLKNQKVEASPSLLDIKVFCPDGTTRVYKNSQKFDAKELFDRRAKVLPSDSKKYLLVKEELPNGNKIIYEWPKKKEDPWMIKSCNQDETIIYAWAKFYPKNGKKGRSHGDYGIETSDGRHLEYHFFSHNKIHQLKKVESDEGPTENIEYAPYRSRKTFLKVFSWPLGRCIEFSYYMPGDFYNNVKITQDDEICFRVKEILAPRGDSNEKIVTHTFYYNTKRKKTTVIDAEGNHTVYYWNDDLRLTKIDRFIKQDALYNRVKFIWGAKGSKDETNLLCKVLFDEKKEPIQAFIYLYDDFGNVIEEKLYGNLTGEGRALRLNQEGLPEDNSSEVYSKSYQYSLDGKHLLLSSKEDNGLKMRCSYLGNTNLIQEEEYYDHETLSKRKTYRYNDQKILIQETLEDLRGSTCLVTNFTLRGSLESYPCMPKEIEEKAGEELLNKTVLHYTKGARISREEMFDSLGVHRYTLGYDYENGLLKREINALSYEAESFYDEAYNKIAYVGFGQRSKMTLGYDYCNRLRWVAECANFEKDQTILDRNYKYNNLNQKTDSWDEFKNHTNYRYDPFGNLLEVKLAGEGVISSTYNAVGCAISRKDPMGHTTYTSYNIYKEPVHILYPDETEEFFLYYKDGTLKTHKDQKGLETTYFVDAFGRVLRKETPYTLDTFTYDSFNLLSETDAEKITTFYEYDKAGRKIAKMLEDEIITYAYDPLGRLYKKTHGDLVLVYIYNNLDQVLEERKEDLSGNWLEKISYEYDAAGNTAGTTKYVNGRPSKEILDYDPFNRLIKRTDALGFETKYIHETTPHKKTTIDPLGLQTVETFNAQNKLDTLERYSAKGDLLLSESYGYDLSGNMERKEAFFNSQTQLTIKEYDPMNRVSSLREGAFTKEEKVTQYTYTPTGLLFTITKPSGKVLTHAYDDLYNLRYQTSSDKTIYYSYEYDLTGNLLKTKNENTGDQIVHILDAKGNLKQEIFPSGFIVKNTYDNQSRRRELSLSEGSQILYEYDALHLKRVSRYKDSTFLYDHHYVAHDLSGHVLYQELPLKVGAMVQDYDLLGRCISTEHSCFSQKALEFDPVGNLLLTNRQEEILSYAYDDLYQLILEKDHTYAFDALNNRLQKDRDVYSVNALNQTSELKYNLDGNPLYLEGKKLTYDALDRLISLEDESTLIVYSYDSFHRRLSKKTYALNSRVPSLEVYYLYDGQNEIGSYDATGTLLELRVLGNTQNAEIGSSIAIELKGKVHIPFHDLHGNLSALYSLDGILEAYSYTAFGEENFPPPPSCNPWRFSSKRTDDETGLVYYGRRFYSPRIGRWLTPDPLGLEAGPNLYAFVLNTPLTHLDLYGLIDTEGWFARSMEKARDAVAAAAHGTADFAVQSVSWTGSAFNHLGSSLLDLNPSARETSSMQWASSQEKHLNALNYGITSAMKSLGVETNSDFYQKTRSGTTTTLEVSSLVMGAYGLVKGAVYGATKAIQYSCRQFGKGAVPRSVLWNSSTEAIKGAGGKSAFNIARNGGRNSGFFKNNLCRNAEELKKGVVSFEKQVALHRGKISNPSEYIKNWNELDLRQQQALINKKWPSDIERLTEQRDILQGILNENL